MRHIQGQAETSVIVKVTVKDSGPMRGRWTPLGPVSGQECPPGGPGTAEHLPTCPWALPAEGCPKRNVPAAGEVGETVSAQG